MLTVADVGSILGNFEAWHGNMAHTRSEVGAHLALCVEAIEDYAVAHYGPNVARYYLISFDSFRKGD